MKFLDVLGPLLNPIVDEPVYDLYDANKEGKVTFGGTVCYYDPCRPETLKECR